MVRIPGRSSFKPHDILFLAIVLLYSGLSFSHGGGGFPRSFGSLANNGWFAGVLELGIAMLIVLVASKTRSDSKPFLRFVRLFYPQLLFPLLFQHSIQLSAVVFGGGVHDGLMAGLDQALFGLQPSREFHSAMAGIGFFDELMFGAYFSFYIMITGTPWIPWFRGREEEAEKQLFAMSALMVFALAIYPFFRVEGPKYWFADLQIRNYSQFTGPVFVPLFQSLFKSITLYGSAFPSSHVELSVLSVLLVARSDRRLIIPWAIVALLIACSTVYLYAHWAMDAFAGAFIALSLGPLALRVHDPVKALLAGSAKKAVA